MPNIPIVKRRGRPIGSRTRLPLPPAALGVEPLTVRVDQAAAMVGCGVSKMKQMIADVTVESTKLGSMRLVKVREPPAACWRLNEVGGWRDTDRSETTGRMEATVPPAMTTFEKETPSKADPNDTPITPAPPGVRRCS